VHKILCGMAKAHAAERVNNPEQSVPVLIGKEKQTNEASLTAAMLDYQPRWQTLPERKCACALFS